MAERTHFDAAFAAAAGAAAAAAAGSVVAGTADTAHPQAEAEMPVACPEYMHVAWAAAAVCPARSARNDEQLH